ncbi:hypothetical protein LR48_Vigan10g139300 [Vigna angularis]|uniref:Pectinesterase inhibitor domain-containing protein n=1 Tax=Phaseolus angularis TaxID=3914 RepID=A0A0L9VKD7_PHAAN|nr:hypothetical protein LR48_Vigan10g139300 [Vigna angularis]
MQALIAQACMDIENQNSCLTNIHNELTKIGPPSPTSVMSAALKATLNEAIVAIDNMTKIATFSVSYREQQAIEDYKELLDFLISELAWSLGEMRRIRLGDSNTQSKENLEAWLSVALSNQDMCLEGFEGTNRRLESYISGSLTQPPRNTTTEESDGTSEFPKWMSEGDQELLKAKPHGVRADAVVALDGSGHYRSIVEAVNAAPSHSERRYIIYVKRGLYKENIDMKKKMTNIMLVGHGIGQTIITSNWNFMQGCTTFRTVTLGK